MTNGIKSDINILNFVYETEPQSKDDLRNKAVYKMHLVVSGNGVLAFSGKQYELCEGTLFLTYPSTPYSIESVGELKYMYISCIRYRINEIAESIGVGKHNSVFYGLSEVIPFWKSTASDDRSVLSLRSEGILLYTLSILGENEAKARTKADIVALLKKYIDEHFSDPSLSLLTVGEVFSYNPEYLSTVFKTKVGVGISSYITSLRIQQARFLIDNGFTTVTDIAYKCGFSDQFYFSKIFKRSVGLSPRKYIANRKKEKSRQP